MAGKMKGPILLRYLQRLAKEHYVGKHRKASPPLLLDCQHGINFLLHLQGVPLGDGAPGVGQHV